MQVTLNDQRVLEGDFQCLDKQGNLILGNSIEACLNPISGKREERPMGMVLISKDRQAKVEMQVGAELPMATRSLPLSSSK
jgi:small nuclear ribonucleoprotein (snRNP)-like protein